MWQPQEQKKRPKIEAERKARQEAEEKVKQEAEEKARQVAEKKAKKTAEEKAKQEVDQKVKKEAEDKAKQEAEEKERLIEIFKKDFPGVGPFKIYAQLPQCGVFQCSRCKRLLVCLFNFKNACDLIAYLLEIVLFVN